MNYREILRPWVYSEQIQLSEQFAYGHREVLLASNHLDPTSLVMASVPHGWGPDTIGRPYPKIRNRSAREYPIFSWSVRTANDLVDRGYRLPIAVGSPWAHHVTAISGISKPDLKALSDDHLTKLLFLPSHSVPGGSAQHQVDLKKLIDKIRPDTITICLFWLDYINPKVREYYSAFGFELTCAGFKGSTGFDTPWSPTGGRQLFLPTLYDLILRHNVIVVDTISSPFWYAASLGKTMYIHGDGDAYSWWGNGNAANITFNNRELLKLSNKKLAKLPFNTQISSDDLLFTTAQLELGFENVGNFQPAILKYNILKSGVISPEICMPLQTVYDTPR